MGETWKIRDKVQEYCVGKGLDLGCGDEKVHSDATGVDIRQTQAVDMILDIAQKLPFPDDEFDYVFSSHALEHLDGDLNRVVAEWVRVIREGGFLVLYLPHKDYYKEANPEHRHSFCEDDIISLLRDTTNLTVRDHGLDIGLGRYSFWVVAEKIEMPEKEMLAKKENLLIERGYQEQDFTEEYWTYKHEVLGARINKDASPVVRYLQDLFEKFGIFGPVLEIGAGAGNLVYGLRCAGIESEGCEFSSSGRRLALERFNVVLSECDLRNGLPYNEDQFNWSICLGVLSMIPDRYLDGAIREILRVTRFGVLVNVQTIISEDPENSINPHHILSLSSIEYWNLFHSCGAYDLSSIQPPQKMKYGIGVIDEFAGLFSKRSAQEIVK